MTRLLLRCTAIAALCLGGALAAPEPSRSLAELARSRGLTGFGSAMGGIGRPGSPFSDYANDAVHVLVDALTTWP